MKLNKRKTGFDTGIIAGKTTATAGKYTDFELLRRVTLANLLFESNYYQTSDAIMNQIETLIPKVSGQEVIDLALECRFEQKLRHTPLWLLVLANEYHKDVSVKDALSKIATRPDMLMDMLAMLKMRNGKGKLKIPKAIKKGMALAFNNYDEYQLSKYKKSNLDISLIDVVNLVHPKPTQKNEAALKALVNNTLAPANTWENALSSGADKKETFTRMINEDSLGSLAILRNLRNMKDAGLDRKLIKSAIGNVKSQLLFPLNFLAANRVLPEYTSDINNAMKRCFVNYKIPGTTILAIDVSGSMGSPTSSLGSFNRMDIGFALAALATYVFEDLILVFTAGNDMTRKGKHVVWSNSEGLGIFKEYSNILGKTGYGGIFTAQLTEWLIDEGYAKDADRLIVLSDSQDIDVSHGSTKKPKLTPYKTSYIIDISSNTHGIKSGAWTAEINGSSDRLFRYIAAVEGINMQ